MNFEYTAIFELLITQFLSDFPQINITSVTFIIIIILFLFLFFFIRGQKFWFTYQTEKYSPDRSVQVETEVEARLRTPSCSVRVQLPLLQSAQNIKYCPM